MATQDYRSGIFKRGFADRAVADIVEERMQQSGAMRENEGWRDAIIAPPGDANVAVLKFQK